MRAAAEKFLSACSLMAKAALHLLLPDTCAHCGTDLAFGWKRPLCPQCLARIKFINGLECRRCGVPLPDGGAHCRHCRGSKALKYRCAIIRSAFEFTPELRAVIHALKYKGRSRMAEFLAEAMHAKLRPEPLFCAADMLVPVPLAPKRKKERGYNQSELLAKNLAARYAIPVNATLLARTRGTPSQTSLSRTQRFENMKDAFAVTVPLQAKGRTIILIDDVATTTATLEACAAALKKCGAKAVYALTAAREP